MPRLYRSCAALVKTAASAAAATASMWGSSTRCTDSKRVEVSREEHGAGRVTIMYSDGSCYRGTTRGGVIDGYGAMTYGDGHTAAYVGEWRDGKHHGKGILRNSACGVYFGEFRDDDKHGHGIEMFPGGNCYEGGYAHDELHGHGLYRYRSGGTWEGAFVEGNREDDVAAVYRYGNGDVYHGGYRDAQKNGMGVFAWNDPKTAAGRRQYAGQFSGDKMHGQGVLILADGSVFTGSFESDRFHGSGRLVDAAGRVVQEGEWAHGQFVAASTVGSGLGVEVAGSV